MRNNFEIFRRQRNSCQHPVANQHFQVQLYKSRLTQFLLAGVAEVRSGLIWNQGSWAAGLWKRAYKNKSLSVRTTEL